MKINDDCIPRYVTGTVSKEKETDTNAVLLNSYKYLQENYVQIATKVFCLLKEGTCL